MAVLYDFVCTQLAFHSGECRQSNQANIVEKVCKIQETQPTKGVRGLCVCRQVAVEGKCVQCGWRVQIVSDTISVHIA